MRKIYATVFSLCLLLLGTQLDVAAAGCQGNTAGFTFTTSNLTVNFNNLSQGSYTSYAWAFGDGATSTTMSPNHTYPTNGTYNACLFATDTCGTDTFCTVITVPCNGPTSVWFFNAFGQTVNFTDNSQGSPISFFWDFGDGNTSTTQSPTHAYLNPGNYTACLVVQNACGSDSSCQTVSVGCPLPSAAFTASPSGLTVSFTDNSTGNPSARVWDFGDGNTSTQTNPTHTYAAAGTYTVCLGVQNTCGQDSSCQTVIVTSGGTGCTNPNADFSFQNSSLQVSFADFSTVTGGTIYAWDFGDGNTATTQNPLNTYSSPGTYTVCLLVSDSCGTDSICKNVTVVVNCNTPQAAYFTTANQTSITFNDQSSGTPTDWNWDFGDGSTGSTQQNPTHTYNTTGTYTVCLTVENACGIDSICQQITVTCQTPTSGFTSSNNFYTVSFTDQSSNGSSYLWTFGDGTTSTIGNPSHTYNGAGTYTICQIVTNACGTDSTCQTINLTCPTPVAGFSATNSQNVATFTDMSSSSSAWTWTFGDGGTSTAQNPIHNYTSPGTYLVCLTASSICGSNTSCQQVTVTCPLPTATFNFAISGLTVTATDGSSGATSWFWNFGDGNIDTQQNTSHTYGGYGTYLLCLTASNGCRSATHCETIELVCPTPVSGFTFSHTNLTYTFADTSSGGTNYAWSFGDGTFSGDQNPTHTYSQDGQYTVCQYATNNCGTDTTCELISVVGMEEAFGQQLSIYPQPARDYLVVEGELEAGGNASFRILNLMGQEMIRSEEELGGGAFSTRLNLQGLADGAYILEAEFEGIPVRKRIILQR